MQIPKDGNSSPRGSPVHSSSMSRTSISRSSTRRQMPSPKVSPMKMTPLWIQLSGDLLMAPKKKIGSIRRFTVPKTTTIENASTVNDQVDNATVKPSAEPRRSTRHRICRDLFGVRGWGLSMKWCSPSYIWLSNAQLTAISPQTSYLTL